MALRVLPEIETQGDSGEKSPMWPHDRWHGRDCTRRSRANGPRDLERRVGAPGERLHAFLDPRFQAVLVIRGASGCLLSVCQWSTHRAAFGGALTARERVLKRRSPPDSSLTLRVSCQLQPG